MPDLLGPRLTDLIAQHAAEYWLPFWETPYEYHRLRVVRAGRLSEDRWYVTDGSHRYHWGGDCFRIEPHQGETREEWFAHTEKPFAQAYAKAEEKAATLRQETHNRIEAMIARRERSEALEPLDGPRPPHGHLDH